RRHRGGGEEHLVVDIHPIPELLDLRPPSHERAAILGGLLVIERRRDQDDHRPEEPEEPARELIAAVGLDESGVDRRHGIPLPCRELPVASDQQERQDPSSTGNWVLATEKQRADRAESRRTTADREKPASA